MNGPRRQRRESDVDRRARSGHSPGSNRLGFRQTTDNRRTVDMSNISERRGCCTWQPVIEAGGHRGCPSVEKAASGGKMGARCFLLDMGSSVYSHTCLSNSADFSGKLACLSGEPRADCPWGASALDARERAVSPRGPYSCPLTGQAVVLQARHERAQVWVSSRPSGPGRPESMGAASGPESPPRADSRGAGPQRRRRSQ